MRVATTDARVFRDHSSGTRRRNGTRLRGEHSGVESFVCGESELGIFQIPFWDPRIFFGRISFPSDQERSFGWSSAVA